MRKAGLDLSGRIPELDGLRGLAILIVVLFHYYYFGAGPEYGVLRYFLNSLSLGWSGVDLFFVLSGFLIGGILLDAKDSSSYFKAFYVRRFFRIIPIYYLWITTFIFLLVFGGRLLQAHTHSHVLPLLGFSVFEQYLFLQNIWIPANIFVAGWWLDVTWSLAVEEQFYLVAPLLIRFLDRAKLRILLILMIFTAPLLRTWFFLHEHPLALHAYALMPCRADALSLGMLTALCWREEEFRDWLSTRRRSLFLLLLILLAGMVALSRWSSDPFRALAVTIGISWIDFFYATLLLFTLANRGGIFAWFTRMKWLRELGRVSYCIYLIHRAVAYLVFGLVVRRLPRPTDLGTFSLTLVSAALTYLVARLSWRYIEGPLVRIGHRTSYQFGALLPAVASPAVPAEGH